MLSGIANMKIIEFHPDPISTFFFLNAGRGPGQFYEDRLPVHHARVDRLPEGISAIVVTADLQGRERFQDAIDGPPRLLGEVVPLRLVTWLALAVIGLTVVAGGVVVVVKLINPHYFIPGYPSIIITIVFFGGVQLLALGIIGEYLGRMYEATKARPIYILEQVYCQENGKVVKGVRN